MPAGWYALTKRFTAKEEPRRIVAALYDPTKIVSNKIGFENHINVFHKNKKGLDPNLARGLTVYLNSTLFDLLFRQFSGHTQVNASDLRIMNYPDYNTLKSLAEKTNSHIPAQDEIDELIKEEIKKMAKKDPVDPISIKKKTDEALSILADLGFPKAQQNERSALTLLALLDMKPLKKWMQADEPLMGITPTMDFIRDHYGITYAPNTRETIRRQTMHQFVDAGVAVPNPDDPERPINPKKSVNLCS